MYILYAAHEQAVSDMIAPNLYLFFVTYGNIIFDLRLFDLRPIFQECN